MRENGPYETDERFAAEYTLPDPLKKDDGTRITTPEEWLGGQRERILQLLKDNEYGEVLPPPDNLEFQLLAQKDDALGGTAIRKEIRITSSMKDGRRHSFIMLLYLPKNAQGPVPAFLGLNFKGNHNTTEEADVIPTGQKFPDALESDERGLHSYRWCHKEVVANGFASATACYHDIHPDYADSAERSVFRLFFQPQEYPRIWEKYSIIGAWAWGLSRCLDYLEEDPEIQSDRVAIHGHSRLGKTALWAGAIDQRFKMVIANCSGCGGAALHRRKIGENLSQHRFFAPDPWGTGTPCWFVKKAGDFIWKEEALPIDQHELMAMIAPRPLVLGTATLDANADPRGEFLAAKAAEEVYALFGSKGLPTKTMPPPDTNITGDISFHCRTGKHDQTPQDWKHYLTLAKLFL